MSPDIDLNQLFNLIGRQAVEIDLLRTQVALLQQKLVEKEIPKVHAEPIPGAP
jgi:hypothetical protein